MSGSLKSTVLGSGPDKLELWISQDSYLGDAQYTVTVDGQQVNGIFTASAQHDAGEEDSVAIWGDWGGGSHTVSIAFLNDAYRGTPATDRNLYVDRVAYHDVIQHGAPITLWSEGAHDFSFLDLPPYEITLGKGGDLITLWVSQDAYRGNAQYLLSVDGKLMDGVLTASALHGEGQHDVINLLGTWTAGDHTIDVTFLNDMYDGAPNLDRNLYVVNATPEPHQPTQPQITLYSGGSQSLNYFDYDFPKDLTIGRGLDELALSVTQDRYLGDASYIILMDGQQVDGTLVASKGSSEGLHDTIHVRGDWPAGVHTVSVDFLNDAYGGTPETDRNLYIDDIVYNGCSVQPPGPLHFFQGGRQNFTIADQDCPAQLAFGTGPDRIEVRVAQDAFEGSAQCTLIVGQQSVTFTSSRAANEGNPDIINFYGDWSLGSTINISAQFLNDAYGGTPDTDRNLRIETITLNGESKLPAPITLWSAGTQTFDIRDDVFPHGSGVLPDVPSYQWYFGCSPTAVASILAYWDQHGYPSYFDAQGWDSLKYTSNVAEQISSSAHNAKYGRSTFDNIDDPNLPDPPDTSIADFLNTSVDPAKFGATLYGNIASGIEGYAAYRGAPVDVREVWIGSSNYLSVWNEVLEDLKAGNPVLMTVDTDGNGSGDHSIPVFGYDNRADGSEWYGGNQAWYEAEETVWHQFVPASPNADWGVTTVFFIHHPGDAGHDHSVASDPTYSITGELGPWT